ncbi:MAG: cation diffusion facilitator family transporter [Candidatus Odinarchaeota archaeon]
MTDINYYPRFYENPIFLNFFLLIVNIIFFNLKLIFSSLTRSMALRADAFDTLTDIVMVFAAFIGFLYSRKKPNEKFPYGYYKIENIISLFISLFIFYTAYIIILETFQDIVNFIQGNFRIIKISPLSLIFLIISLIVSLIITYYLKTVGKKTNSPVIKSEASEKLYDNIISLSVLIGFIGSTFNLYFLDSIIGLTITIFIIKGGFDIFLNSTKVLLDAVIDFDKRTELNNMIKNFPKIKDIESLNIRAYGKYIFLETSISLSNDLSLIQIQSLKNQLIAKIKEKYPQIFKVLILIQTQENPITKIAVPLIDTNGLYSKLSDHFGEALYFALFEIKENEKERQLLNYNIFNNRYLKEEKRKGLLISDWLISMRIDKIYLKKELKIGPNLIFEKGFIQIVITPYNELSEIIEHELK